MATNQLIGIGLLVLGAVLLVMGISASDSVADQMSRTFTGRFTDETAWYIIGGIIAAVVGLVLTFGTGRRHHIA